MSIQRILALAFWTVLNLTGLGALIDLFIRPADRARIHHAISRVKSVAWEEMEGRIVTSLLELFSKPGELERISVKRVYFLSLMISIFFVLYINSISQIGDTVPVWSVERLTLSLKLAFVASLVSLPFDYFSIYVSRRLFFYRHHPPVRMILVILLDAAISLVPVILLVPVQIQLIEVLDLDWKVLATQMIIATLLVAGIANGFAITVFYHCPGC